MCVCVPVSYIFCFPIRWLHTRRFLWTSDTGFHAWPACLSPSLSLPHTFLSLEHSKHLGRVKTSFNLLPSPPPPNIHSTTPSPMLCSLTSIPSSSYPPPSLSLLPSPSVLPPPPCAPTPTPVPSTCDAMSPMNPAFATPPPPFFFSLVLP